MMYTCSTFVVVLDVDFMNRANITNKRCSMISSRIIESAIHLRKSAISSLQFIDQSFPKLSLGKHNVHGRTVHVIRIFKTVDGKQKCFEYSITAPRGKKLLSANQKVFLVRKALAALSSDDLFVTRSIRNNSKAPEKPAWLIFPFPWTNGFHSANGTIRRSLTDIVTWITCFDLNLNY